MIGIIGQGFVGNAVYLKFRKFYDVFTYDLDSSKCNSSLEQTLNNKFVFICLPTPMNDKGRCDVSIVKSALEKCSLSPKNKIVIIKSTIPPGTTHAFNEEFVNLKAVFNPEFLTERNAVEDYNRQNRIILGGPRSATSEVKLIFSKVFPGKQIIKTDSTHAEMIKYFTNAFLSVKVSFANEVFQMCQELDIDYDKVIEYAVFDKRLGNSHWGVPGHDGDFGFGGHCFPKDLSEFIGLSDSLKTTNNVIKAAKKTNDSVRKNRDWEKMKGRAVN